PKDDKGKVRVFLFELEGTNETLLESIRSITGVLTQTFGGPPKTVVRMMPMPAQGESVDGKTEEIDVSSEETDSTEKENSSTPKPKRRTITTPEILDLALNSGSVTLTDFVASKKPSDDTKKYLVIASWLKSNLQLEEITIAHIYTCYR